MQWSQVLADPSLQNLPYKIELNQQGNIEMSPASNKHGLVQTEVSFLLRQHLRRGRTITECVIKTEMGIKVADVAWGSDVFFQSHSLEQDPFQQAPEICVEIISPGNRSSEMQQKTQLYLQQGAQEVWLVDLSGHCRFFSAEGERQNTRFEIPGQAFAGLKDIPW
ncbi:Uncharacterised protein [Candidatus Venteria ishoeyi]|uniref:Putative restriction endonuclease domain-containing protein n=2 Tax=Candidatus Venteria ishoeyi TaxID=1899563 RepID=A0A1H6FEP6_9GAMM|nr:Uncharacterised protein [Candidatus Venteria ishoeyi]